MLEWVKNHPYPSNPNKVQQWQEERRQVGLRLGLKGPLVVKCAKCKDISFILSGDEVIPCPACSTFNRGEGLRKYAGIPDRRTQDTFNTFHLKDAPLMKEAYNATLEFATGHNETPWLVVAGPTGCGKTHLCYAAANEMSQHGWKVRMWVVADLLDAMRSSFHQKEGDPKINPQKEFEEMAYEPEVLILDDIGGEKVTDWVAEELFQIIDRRYREGRPLMVTTNEDINRLPERIKSRFTDKQICRIVATDSPDFRPKMEIPRQRFEPQEVKKRRRR